MISADADLHCHLLFDWDDGPRDVEGSITLAQRAAQAGVARILVTPHVGRSFAGVERTASEIPAATRALQDTLRENNVDITLVAGAEVAFEADLAFDKIAQQPWLSVGEKNRYLLIESLSGDWPRYAESTLFQIALGGATPIIAHPERYAQVQDNPAILEPVVRAGALLQITARTLQSEDKSPAQQRYTDCAKRLLESGMASLVASDSHSARGVWPGEVVDELVALVGEEAARNILQRNPNLVLDGKPVPQTEIKAVAPPKKSWSLASLFKRGK